MNRKPARIFRKENEILFSESDDSDFENDGEDEPENEPESDENEENPENMEDDVSKLQFEICNSEHKISGRPSKLRGTLK